MNIAILKCTLSGFQYIHRGASSGQHVFRVLVPPSRCQCSWPITYRCVDGPHLVGSSFVRCHTPGLSALSGCYEYCYYGFCLNTFSIPLGIYLEQNCSSHLAVSLQTAFLHHLHCHFHRWEQTRNVNTQTK